MKCFKLLFLPLLIFFVSKSAFAEGYFRLGGMYMSDRETVGGSTSKSTTTLLDIGSGWVGGSGLTIGALYSTSQHDPNSGRDTVAYGPTLGWMETGGSGVYILGTYLVHAERDDKSKGTGTQFDLGYRFGSGAVSFAPQISFKNYEYDKRNGSTLSPKTKESRVDPYFVLFVNF